MENILSIEGLTKKYRRLKAVNDLSLEINKGQVFGLLGPNGSGKTTTLGVILDVIQPTSGSYKWFGQAPSNESRRKIGSILETPCFYPYLSAGKNLKIIAQIKDCGYSRIDEVLDWVGLLERKNDAFKTYSLGMKQRLAIASALLADPPVMILDEPTNGLDPSGIAEIRELIIQIAEKGKTIILASHLLDEVQKVCTHFAILRKGKQIYSGEVEEVLNSKNSIEVASDNRDLLKSALADWPKKLTLEDNKSGFVVGINGDVTSAELNRYLVEKDIIVSHLAQKRSNLEQEFLKILSDHDG
ncbi:MAG: ABC transporter ATP-binding protein [Cyclobacteriaceae bacterium]